jgi:hypothetical protein
MEHFGYVNRGKFLDQPSDYQFLKNNSTWWSQRDAVTDTALRTPTVSLGAAEERDSKRDVEVTCLGP